MNREEAKFILQAYRPDGRDAQDAQFAEALEQLKHDPALAEWFHEQQALDDTIAEKLRSAPVPSNLRAEILAGQKTVHPSAWWSRRSALAALAACLVVLLGLAGTLFKSDAQPSFADYRTEMVHFVQDLEQGSETLRLKTSDVQEIRAWLQANAGHEPVVLPAHLTADSGLGCRVLKWKGNAVALACFRLEDDSKVHVLIIDAEKVGGCPDDCTRYFASVEDMNTTAWTTGLRTYLMVSRAPEETLRKLQ